MGLEKEIFGKIDCNMYRYFEKWTQDFTILNGKSTDNTGGIWYI